MGKRMQHDSINSATGRPVCRDVDELLALARRGVGLRIVEIHRLAKASGEDVVSKQMLDMIEKTAMEKIRAVFDMSPTEFVPVREPRPTKRRRMAMT